MKSISSKLQLIIIVLFAIVHLTCQFSIGNSEKNLQKQFIKKNIEYQLVLDEPMKLKLLKLEETELKTKATLKLPCEPTSFDIHKQSIIVDIEEDTNSYVISVVCKNKELINYIYQVEQETVKKMVVKQNDRNTARLLQSNTTVVCGNKIKEGDETCDDGNRESGDGCSKDCMLECGNGVIDSDLQQCDDGDKNGSQESNCNPQCKKQGKKISGIIIAAASTFATVGLLIGSQAVTAATTVATTAAQASAQGAINAVGAAAGQSTKAMNAI